MGSSTITNHVPAGWTGLVRTWDGHQLALSEGDRRTADGIWCAVEAGPVGRKVCQRTRYLSIVIDLELNDWAVYSNQTGAVLDEGRAVDLGTAMHQAAWIADEL